jgi:hypothetical protein
MSEADLLKCIIIRSVAVFGGYQKRGPGTLITGGSQVWLSKKIECSWFSKTKMNGSHIYPWFSIIQITDSHVYNHGSQT